MNEWYYARGGQQNGPISFEHLVDLARNGTLDRSKDLVWTATMKDWLPAGQVPGLFDHPSEEASNAESSLLTEIIPGSEPLDVMACIKRGFELTKRHFGIIFLVILAYMGIAIASNVILKLLDVVLGLSHQFKNGSPLNIALTQVWSIFLSLGVTRIGLNLISGKEVKVSMLFGEGKKLLRAIGASILFGLMVCLGLILLIVPGIYLAARYGQFLTAIVDRDLGIIEAFNYSSSITANNRLLLFGLWLLSILIIIGGLAACGVGLIFAIPVAWLGLLVAYHWMQYGRRATQD